MKEPQKSMFLFVWILCLTVLFDEEVWLADQVDGLLMFVYGAW